MPKIQDGKIENGKIYLYLKEGGRIIMSMENLMKEIEKRAESEKKNYWNPEPEDYILFHPVKEIPSGFDDDKTRWLGYDAEMKEVILPTSQILTDGMIAGHWYYIKYKGKVISQKNKKRSYNLYVVTKLTDEEVKELKLEPNF